MNIIKVVNVVAKFWTCTDARRPPSSGNPVGPHGPGFILLRHHGKVCVFLNRV
jgi:hypothetical protein